MLKGTRKYYLVFILTFSGLVIYQYLAPRPLNWNRTYISDQKNPFGTNAIYRLLESGFISNKILEQNNPVYNTLKDTRLKEQGPTSYIFIDNRLNFDLLDTRELMNFVKQGNSVFICAANLSGQLADTFSLNIDMDYNNYFTFNKDTFKEKEIKTCLNFTNPNFKRKTDYFFGAMLQNNYFSSFDTLKTIVLGLDQKNKVNLLQINHGKGKFIFSSIPDIFSNFFSVHEPNREYAYKTLSYISNQIIYWDEYYKSGRNKSDSPMRFIISNNALYDAWLLTFISLLLFMIFEIKRKQRIIPLIIPHKNTTLEFVEVIGSVYYASKNHKIIAEEKKIVFLEFIRNKFQISTHIFDEAFYGRVCALSGIDRKELKILFETIDKISYKQQISEQELTTLNNLLDTFYKNNKR
jgi:hypothetical protein